MTPDAASLPLTLTEIAGRISAYLKLFEGDKAINTKRPSGTSRFWDAYAWRAGKYVMVRYVSYQGPSSLRRAEAERYLAWLDAGNVGKHIEVKASWFLKWRLAGKPLPPVEPEET